MLLALLGLLLPQLPPPLAHDDPKNPWPPTLANGEFGVTLPPLGLQAAGPHRERTVVAGVWNGPRLTNDGWPNYQQYLPEVPSPAVLALRFAGQDLLAAAPAGYHQELDLARGELVTRFRVAVGGGEVAVVVRQFASRVRPELFATHVEVTPTVAGELEAKATLDLDSARGVRWVGARQDTAAGRHLLRLRTLAAETEDHPRTDIELAQELRVGGGGPLDAWQDEDRIWLTGKAKAAAGAPLVVTLLATLRTSRRAQLLPFYDDTALAAAAQAGFDALAAEQAAAWDTFWRGTRIVVDGDDELQAVADAALFSLCSALRPGGDDSLGPMGLAKIDRNSYAGHVFWDAETWMFPPLLLLQPELARAMLEYRCRRMEGARQNAILKGVTSPGVPWNNRALYFPWESAQSGMEATPQWFVPGNEIHNNAAIALAAWQFAQVQGDAAFAATRAAPLCAGIAEFYAARAHRDADGAFHLRDVTCADEWAERKDDSAFVNATAARALRIAAGFRGADEARWREVADGLVQPFDPAHGIHPEYAGYDGGGIKQADVVLMAYPWGLVTEPERVRADLEYYAPRTAREAPAMSHAIHAILWAQLGDEAAAVGELDAAWRHNVHGPFRIWSETPNNGCVHFLTGVGGFLQALLNGFGGIRVVDGGLTAHPLLPAGWRGFTVRGLCVGDAAVELRVTRDGATVVPLRGVLAPGRLVLSSAGR